MFESHNQAVVELLRVHRLASEEQLNLLTEEHRASGKPVAALAVDLGIVERQELLRQTADALGYRYVSELPERVPDELAALMPDRLARDSGAVPFRLQGHSLEVLVADPFDSQALADLGFALGRDVHPVVADPTDVEELLHRTYGEAEITLEETLRGLEQPAVKTPVPDASLSSDEIAAMAGQGPVVRFVNVVLNQAVRDQASDIHFEPFEHEFKIRYRVDGALYELTPPPKGLALAITSRIKVLADLNIAERRVPQDGRIKLALGGRPVDLRVSTLPTQFGESVVLRVLDRATVRLRLPDLGMPPEVLQGLQDTIRRPNGILIVTGPTGSGKTTTLYSALCAINTPDLKVLTAEDPVEYDIEGLTQVPVNPAIGLTFAAALRSFLRQDPDVVMVGEIRDLETAQIAVQASLTGHLVLTTLHTNDAVGAITRLIDLGVEPFLLASSLAGVLAQRLVRRICPDCRGDDPRARELLGPLGHSRDGAHAPAWQRGRGCAACAQTGYRGRQGIFEWLAVSEQIRELITANAPAQVIRERAIAEGMRLLREDGLTAARAGITTVDEVLRYT